MQEDDWDQTVIFFFFIFSTENADLFISKP